MSTNPFDDDNRSFLAGSFFALVDDERQRILRRLFAYVPAGERVVYGVAACRREGLAQVADS